VRCPKVENSDVDHQQDKTDNSLLLWKYAGFTRTTYGCRIALAGFMQV
jgi:hypothetical protein